MNEIKVPKKRIIMRMTRLRQGSSGPQFTTKLPKPIYIALKILGEELDVPMGDIVREALIIHLEKFLDTSFQDFCVVDPEVLRKEINESIKDY